MYQQLENAGGVSNTTPDLAACIIGPAYNVLTYVAGSTASMIKTAATSATTGIASITAGTPTLTFTANSPFVNGDSLLIPGAGVSGATLNATVIAVLGAVVTLDTSASISVSNAVISKTAGLTNPNSNNSFTLPSQQPGQIIDTTSIQVYANQALVQTLSTGFNGFVGNNSLTYSAASTTGNAIASSQILTGVANVSQFAIGDTITVAGAGASGSTLTAKIQVIASGSLTLNTPALTSATGAVITKAAISNINSTTSTLLLEVGDEVVVTYVDTTSTTRTLTSTAIQVVNASGTLTNVTIADVIPAGAQVTTTATGALTQGATGFTLTSSTGFNTGDTILIKGAGSGGTDLIATIGTLTGAVITGLSPAIGATVASGAVVQKQVFMTLQTRKSYNNQLIPLTKPLSGGANYNTSNTGATGVLVLEAEPELIYGPLIKADIYIAYNALRTDLGNRILTITDQNDNIGVFGTVNQFNPLALGCQVALANTTTSVNAIAINSNDDAGYLEALDLAQSQRLYALAPLTQSLEVLQAFNLHAQEMSIPKEASWRVALVNSTIPTTTSIGSYTADIVNANSGNNTITLSSGNYVLNASNATFISDGVSPGDTVHITSATGSPTQVGTVEVLTVVSNQQLIVAATGTATAVSYYITRTMSKTQRAAAVAATSSTFNSNRLIHVQPDICVINIAGADVVLPGYYICCALAGLIAGFPSQQGFTNIGIAGISDLSDSNFTFTRAQLDTMAAAGTCLFVQQTAGGIPYCRHELTTDMSVYQYRELQAVKNWDFLSYYFHDILKPFIGQWNITTDTIGVIRQTLISGAELLMSQKLPRIGAPLIGYTIVSLAQDKTNTDQLNVVMNTIQPSVLNYLQLYLVI